jgi:SAM-dependent methyltransferase
MTTPSLPDPTFRSYTSAEVKTYATHRLSYSQSLYSAVIQHHASTGGQFDLLLDVGCGPGNATRDVALEFERAVGADPGEQMIEAAREIGGTTKSGEDIRFVVQGAEEIAGTEGLQEVNGEGKVDLLIAAMAVS